MVVVVLEVLGVIALIAILGYAALYALARGMSDRP